MMFIDISSMNKYDNISDILQELQYVTDYVVTLSPTTLTNSPGGQQQAHTRTVCT